MLPPDAGAEYGRYIFLLTPIPPVVEIALEASVVLLLVLLEVINPENVSVALNVWLVPSTATVSLAAGKVIE